jgi:hypothetical protein
VTRHETVAAPSGDAHIDGSVRLVKHSHLFSVLFGIGMAGSGCVVHSHGSMTVDGSAVVDVYQEPPPPRPDTPTVERPGFIWVHGRWTWQNNQWVWLDGHWDRERAGQAWADGHWEKRGTSWHWIEGNWAAGGGGEPGMIANPPRPNGGEQPIVRDHRTEEPAPPPQEPVVRDHRTGGNLSVTISAVPTGEPPAARMDAHEATKAGFVWQNGRWNWVNGKWEWVPGHWERERANQHYIDGKWELQGGTWTWTEGRWEAAPAGPVIRDHRH